MSRQLPFFLFVARIMTILILLNVVLVASFVITSGKSNNGSWGGSGHAPLYDSGVSHKNKNDANKLKGVIPGKSPPPSSLLPGISGGHVNRKSGQPPKVDYYTTAISILKTEEPTTTTEITTPKSKEGNREQAATALSKLDYALFVSYFCNIFALTLPIIFLPYVAAERKIPTAAFTATVASIATLGGGLGKLLNGLVCQELGGRMSSMMYHIGAASCSFLLTCGGPASSVLFTGCLIAAMEFFASIQWTANSLLLFNHYHDGKSSNKGQSDSQLKFSRGVSIVTLASTSGVVFGKLLTTFLLQRGMVTDWRSIARLGAIMAMIGAVVVRTFVSEYPISTDTRSSNGLPMMNIFNKVSSKPTTMAKKTKNESNDTNNNNSGKKSAINAFREVLANPLFWQFGFAHATIFLARSSDRIMGAYFEDVTNLPRHICGGSTAVTTLGFLHGLYKGNSFHRLKDIPAKVRMMSYGYVTSVLSALGLAVFANPWVRTKLSLLLTSMTSFVSPTTIVGIIVAYLTFAMASSLSFQFYQIPQMVTNTAIFKENKSVCLSLFDGMGFFLSAIVWALTSRIVSAAGSSYGWSITWIMLGAFFGAGGKVMTKKLPSVLSLQEKGY